MAENVYPDAGAKVADGIFIGSLSTAVSQKCLENLKIDVIVNLSGTVYKSTKPMKIIKMNDIDVTTDTMERYLAKFAAGVKYINTARLLGLNVLIHCAAGINRSATLIGFYLLDTGMRWDDVLAALEKANEERNVALLTNYTFRYLLQARDSFRENFDKKTNDDISIYAMYGEFLPKDNKAD